MARRVLHLVESPPLFIESELDLCRLLQLPRLIPVERPFGLDAPRLRLNRGVELVEARLQIGHLKILRQDLPIDILRHLQAIRLMVLEAQIESLLNRLRLHVRLDSTDGFASNQWVQKLGLVISIQRNAGRLP